MVLAKLVSGMREAGAYARQAWLLPRDTREPVMPRSFEAGDHVVVFVHGLFASAGVLRPMRFAIEREPGLKAAALSYPPGPGAVSISARLKELFSRFPTDSKIHIVGHSLGGIIARHYAVTTEDERIVSTVALATPFGGVRSAKVLGFEWARDLDPDGEILRTIRLAQPKRPIPHLSLIAGDDVLASSPISHTLPSGDTVVMPNIGHNTILFDREAIRRVVHHVRWHR